MSNDIRHHSHTRTDRQSGSIPLKDASSTALPEKTSSQRYQLPDNPTEGNYEWQKTEDGKKITNYLYSEKEPLLGFAGLYEWWADPSLPKDDPERWLPSCTVLTTTTQDALSTSMTVPRSSSRGTGSLNG
ncbi:SOS response-associated peptidase family protein [Arthrobacter sp. SAFR-044]|uniref:SOS response-associated peptidase family protein n=1 Tax=Arthrobacter sp. SAFR-044 TaxID=3387278 RepID=UPI003F7B8719